MWKQNKHLIIAAALVFLAAPSFVFAVSQSASYKLYGGQINMSGGVGTSASYKVSGGANPAGGSSAGTNYKIQGGAPASLVVEPSSSATTQTTPDSKGGFAGGDFAAPDIVSLDIIGIGRDRATVVLETRELALVSIQYGILNAFDKETPGSTAFARTHTIPLSKLKSGALYRFVVRLRDTSGNSRETLPFSFRTLPVATATPAVSNFKAVRTREGVTLSWKNPAFPDFKEVVLVRRTDFFPKTTTDGLERYRGVAQALMDSAVQTGVTYYYAIFVLNQSGVSSGAAVAQVGPEITPGAPPEEGAPPSPPPPFTPLPARLIIPKIEEEVFKELIPAAPPPLPEGVAPVPEEGRLGENIIRLFTFIKQSVAEGYKDAYKVFADAVSQLSDDTKKKLNAIKEGLVDQFGLREEVYQTLTEEERREVEEVVGTVVPPIPSPPVFDGETVTSSIPFGIETDKFGARWHIFAGTDTLLAISADLFQKKVDVIVASFERQAYLLAYNPDSESYEAVLKAPEQKGRYEMVIQVIYEDHTFDEIRTSVLVDPYGYVYEKRWRGWTWQSPFDIFKWDAVLVAGAHITLFVKSKTGEWVVWPAYLYNQFNPQRTAEDGAFAFLAPSNTYYLTVEAAGYRPFRSRPFEVAERIVNINVQLARMRNMRWYAFAGGGILLILVGALLAVRRLKRKVTEII